MSAFQQIRKINQHGVPRQATLISSFRFRFICQPGSLAKSIHFTLLLDGIGSKVIKVDDIVRSCNWKKVTLEQHRVSE